MKIIFFISVLFSVSFVRSFELSTIEQDPVRCQPITIDLCRDIGYQNTSMLNAFGNNQEETALEANQFWPLVRAGCSPVIKQFLCAVFTPMCTPKLEQHISACRDLCERAKLDCEPLMNRYGFNWPLNFNCSSFPENQDDGALCIPLPDEIKNSSAKRDTNSYSSEGRRDRRSLTHQSTRCTLYSTTETREIQIGCDRSGEICLPDNFYCAFHRGCQKPLGWCAPRAEL